MIKNDNKMRSSIYAWLLLPLAIIAGCRSSRESQATPDTATWRQEPFTIDGSDKEWTKPLPGYSGSEKISYEIANDGQNLYILMSVKDPQEQQKIIQGGMPSSGRGVQQISSNQGFHFCRSAVERLKCWLLWCA